MKNRVLIDFEPIDLLTGIFSRHNKGLVASVAGVQMGLVDFIQLHYL